MQALVIGRACISAAAVSIQQTFCLKITNELLVLYNYRPLDARPAVDFSIGIFDPCVSMRYIYQVKKFSKVR